MTLKLIENNHSVKEISMEEFLNSIKPNSFYYFYRETSYKNLKDLIDKLTEMGYSVYFREVKYGLDAESYMYEMHIL
jgi:hypothetical protein